MRNLLGLLFLVCISWNCSNQPTTNSSSETKVETATVENRPFTDTTACILAQAAYCADPGQQLSSHLPGWKVVWNPQPVGGNYAFVATDGNTYALSFRGSLISFTADAFANWFEHDLNIVSQEAWTYATPKARISTGAYTAWQNVEKMKDIVSGKTLWDFLSTEVKEANPVVLTGHSLGGNMAIVYASYCWSRYNQAGKAKSNMEVITFAAPAPGNSAFADDFDEKFPNAQRIENKYDIVPKFPCSDRLADLAELYSPELSAASVSIGYKQATIKLSSVFRLLGTTLDLWKLRSGFTGYAATNGTGRVITIPLSKKNAGSDPAAWFAEAGYQHGMAQYARALGAPVLPCD